jgi:hypothetical protein
MSKNSDMANGTLRYRYRKPSLEEPSEEEDDFDGKKTKAIPVRDYIVVGLIFVFVFFTISWVAQLASPKPPIRVKQPDPIRKSWTGDSFGRIAAIIENREDNRDLYNSGHLSGITYSIKYVQVSETKNMNAVDKIADLVKSFNNVKDISPDSEWVFYSGSGDFF